MDAAAPRRHHALARNTRGFDRRASFDERTGIVDTVRSLLMLNDPQFEVIVVNDGSTDGHPDVCKTFGLVEAPCNHASEVATQPVRAIYRSVAIRESSSSTRPTAGRQMRRMPGSMRRSFP